MSLDQCRDKQTCLLSSLKADTDGHAPLEAWYLNGAVFEQIQIRGSEKSWILATSSAAYVILTSGNSEMVCQILLINKPEQAGPFAFDSRNTDLIFNPEHVYWIISVHLFYRLDLTIITKHHTQLAMIIFSFTSI